MQPIYYFYGAVFLGVLCLLEAVYFLFSGTNRRGDERAVNRRLRLLTAGGSGEEVLRKLTHDASAEGGLAAWLTRFPPYRGFDNIRHMAGVRTPTPKLLAGALVIVLMLFAGGVLLVPLAPSRAAPLAVGVGALLPSWVLGQMAKRRSKIFQSQLVDAVEVIVRSLRAGHPVASALGLVAREMPDPVGSEFGLTFDEMTYGLDLRDALENLARRVPHPELHYLVVAIRVQYGTGGNLAEVLGSLAKVLRERAGMQAKIGALSAEARFSAIILSALPVVVGLLVNVLSPDYYHEVANDPLFPVIMGTGVGGVVLGILMLKKMVSFRI